MKMTLPVLGAILLATPVLAQTSTAPVANTPDRGSPAQANSGPASTGIASPTATGASSITNNPAGASNAEQPTRAAPNTGRGGGGGGTGGGGRRCSNDPAGQSGGVTTHARQAAPRFPAALQPNRASLLQANGARRAPQK